MSAKVNLTRRVTIEGKDRYAPVVVSANGRIKPDYVFVGGKEIKVASGKFYIDWTVGGQRKRKNVGVSAAQAVTAQLRKATELKAKDQGISVVSEDVPDKRRKLDITIVHYLDEIALNKKRRTLTAYSNSLKLFAEFVGKTHLEEIVRMDLLRFSAYLRDEKEQQPRTVLNNFVNVLTFIRSQGITGIVRKGDLPVFVHADVEVYERADLDRFFAVCDRDEKLMFEFLLMTGMREGEAMHTTWRDINPAHATISMRWKPDYSWTPKAYREREIPVPSKLIQALESAKPAGVSSRALLFPTYTGRRNRHMLEQCKRVAVRAGLDPDNFWLHKFRSTFCTAHLQNGIDLATVQNWMGHKDLGSTMRYLKPARNEAIRARVDATFA